MEKYALWKPTPLTLWTVIIMSFAVMIAGIVFVFVDGADGSISKLGFAVGILATHLHMVLIVGIAFGLVCGAIYPKIKD